MGRECKGSDRETKNSICKQYRVADRNACVFRGEWVLSIDIEMESGIGTGIEIRAATAMENTLTNTNSPSLSQTQTHLLTGTHTYSLSQMYPFVQKLSQLHKSTHSLTTETQISVSNKSQTKTHIPFFFFFFCERPLSRSRAFNKPFIVQKL